MILSEQLIQKIEKDYYIAGGPDKLDWNSFLKGYVASLKRFGGSGGTKDTKR